MWHPIAGQGCGLIAHRDRDYLNRRRRVPDTFISHYARTLGDGVAERPLAAGIAAGFEKTPGPR